MKTGHERFSEGWWEYMTEAEPNTGCHIWTGNVCAAGYGRVAKGPDGAVLTHRIRYAGLFGPIGRGMVVCHRCDNPSCVNPDHLFLGTQKDNMRDMFAKGRGRPNGSGVPATPLLLSVAPNDLSKECLSRWHSTSYTNLPSATAWKRVTGVPESLQHLASDPNYEPKKLHPELSRHRGQRLAAVATAAPECRERPFRLMPRVAVSGAAS